MFALVDCNNFYASCEQVFRPDLIGKPIVVLSNNDGCVVARNTEAKSLDIPMGAPSFKYDRFFKRHGVQVFSSNYPLYGDMSSRVMRILSAHSPHTEIYSIDEAFLLLDNIHGIDYQDFCNRLRAKVKRSTGIQVSIGVALTKTLSKLANRIAKKFPERTGGVYVIDNDEKREKALKWLKVEDIWGIGRRRTRKLEGIGVLTALDFVNLSDAWFRKNMSVVELRLKYELSGKRALELEETAPAKKNIATTRSFDKNIAEFKDVRVRISSFACSCAEKLRKQKSNCSSLIVFVRTNPHRDDLPQYSNSIRLKLPFPTNSSITLTKYAVLGLKRIFKEGYDYKKAGVIVSEISPVGTEQTRLFDSKDPRHSKLMGAIDKINSSIGDKKVKVASEDLEKRFKMRQEFLSRRYTTRLDEVIKVKV